MKENIWKKPINTEAKSSEPNIIQKLEDLKTTIRNSTSTYNANDVHKRFVVLYQEAKSDAHKKMICDSALKYCDEKWINSSNRNIFSDFSDISKVIGQIRAYWNSEKAQLNAPIQPFAPKTNSQ